MTGRSCPTCGDSAIWKCPLCIFQGVAAETLDRLKREHLKPHCKLTLVVRNPEEKDGDQVVSADDLQEVEAAIARLREREDSDGQDAWLARLNAECRCCEICQPAPCPGLQQGGPCDELCFCWEEDDV